MFPPQVFLESFVKFWCYCSLNICYNFSMKLSWPGLVGSLLTQFLYLLHNLFRFLFLLHSVLEFVAFLEIFLFHLIWWHTVYSVAFWIFSRCLFISVVSTFVDNSSKWSHCFLWLAWQKFCQTVDHFQESNDSLNDFLYYVSILYLFISLL